MVTEMSTSLDRGFDRQQRRLSPSSHDQGDHHRLGARPRGPAPTPPCHRHEGFFVGVSMNDEFHVYDTTLRDGAQREGLSLSVADKLLISRHLDDLGVGFIEGGWPGANPKDTEFSRRAQ